MLFRPTGWFALSRGNQRVPGVVVGSLPGGLALIGHGNVATLVGRLRPEFRVVDVDVEGLQGHAITEEIAGWCRAHGLWILLRPSGGADGRMHVFVAVRSLLDDLDAFLGLLRDAYGVGRARIDLREMVRPLTAPHRTGVETRPIGSVSAVLGELLRADPDVSRSSLSPSRLGQQQAGLATALVPRRRHRQNLPDAWQAFLDTGQRPQLHQVVGKDYSRSTFEAIATASMVRAGWTVEESWAAIQRAHPRAMDHARQSRGRWVRHVWNRAVEADNQAVTRPADRDPQVAAAVAAARQRLRRLAWSVPPRKRLALLRVGHAVLDRLERANSRRTPVPERDLVLDTGIRDRTTIRAQLRLLNGPVGFLDVEAFRPGSRDRSSFEFEIYQAAPPAGGVPNIPPPCSHTPLPQRVPASLPPTAWLLARACGSQAEREWSVLDLIDECQLTSRPGAGPSGKQQRTVRESLAVLARYGIVRCTASGGWVFVPAEVADLRARDASWGPLAERIASERQAYRTGGSGRWQVARAAAVKRNQARQRAWWVAQDSAEQRARQTAWATRFAGLSIERQLEFKTVAAHRALRSGVSPAARHQRWIYEMDPEELTLVAMERAARFAALPQPMQVAAARAWETYRREFGVPRGSWQIGLLQDVAGFAQAGTAAWGASQ